MTESGGICDGRKNRKDYGTFSAEAKRIYGTALRNVILYGSCARGDFEADSDIDILVLLDMPQENISDARKKCCLFLIN